MASAVARLISEADRDRIRKAVAGSEQKTSGEIVPYIVERSDAYESAEWRGGALAGIIVATAFAALHELTTLWLPLNFAGLVIAAILAFVARAPCALRSAAEKAPGRRTRNGPPGLPACRRGVHRRGGVQDPRPHGDPPVRQPARAPCPRRRRCRHQCQGRETGMDDVMPP